MKPAVDDTRDTSTTASVAVGLNRDRMRPPPTAVAPCAKYQSAAVDGAHGAMLQPSGLCTDLRHRHPSPVEDDGRRDQSRRPELGGTHRHLAVGRHGHRHGARPGPGRRCGGRRRRDGGQGAVDRVGSAVGEHDRGGRAALGSAPPGTEPRRRLGGDAAAPPATSTARRAPGRRAERRPAHEPVGDPCAHQDHDEEGDHQHPAQRDAHGTTWLIESAASGLSTGSGSRRRRRGHYPGAGVGAAARRVKGPHHQSSHRRRPASAAARATQAAVSKTISSPWDHDPTKATVTGPDRSTRKVAA